MPSAYSARSDLEEPLIAGVFSVVRHNRGGHLMRWRTGPIPGAIEGCLQALKPQAAKAPVADEEEEDDNETGDNDAVGGGRRGELRLVACDTRDETLNWEFERNSTYTYLLKKFPDGPCVASSAAAGSSGGGGVFTLPCDAEDARQIWRICQDSADVKCDA